MTIHRWTRRAVLEGAAAVGAMSCVPTGLAAQTRRAEPLPGRGDIVIRGAVVLTMDERLGDFASGAVHIRNGAIAAVGADVDVSGAEVIDGRGLICMPGFVDTHWHLWISMLRPYVRSDIGELSVFPVSTRLGQHMTPQDAYVSVRLGIAEALSAGVTTVHNWAHNTRSLEHAAAELSAMRDTGIRGRFAYGPAQGMPDDQPMDLEGLASIKRTWMPGDGMLTLGICSRNVGGGSIGGAARGFLSIDMARKDWDGARALGLPITMHTSGASPIMALEQAGLLGPDVQFIHPLLTTPEDRAVMKARGVSYSTSPQLESRRGSQLGVIQLGELLEAGVKVSLSTDHIASVSCDPFSSMRILFALHSHRIGARVPLTLKRLLQLATLDGAVDLGVADRTGSITPGKRADLVLLRATDLNMAPVTDPYEAVVSFGLPANVDTVLIDGRILRRAGKSTAFDEAKIVADARAAALGLREKAGWPT